MTSSIRGLVHTVDAKDLQIGDHIYIWRMYGAYAHHGIVVQINPIGIVHLDTVGIRLTGLTGFAGTAVLHRVRYECTWKESLLKRPGTCSTNSPDSWFVIALRAISLVETEGDDARRVTYHFIFKNCESFCRYCVMGPRSGVTDFRTSQGPDSLQSNPASLARNVVLATGAAVAATTIGAEAAMVAATAFAGGWKTAFQGRTVSADDDVMPSLCGVVNRILTEIFVMNIPDRLHDEGGIKWNDSSAGSLCEMFVDNLDKGNHEEGFADDIASQALLDSINNMIS